MVRRRLRLADLIVLEPKRFLCMTDKETESNRLSGTSRNFGTIGGKLATVKPLIIYIRLCIVWMDVVWCSVELEFTMQPSLAAFVGFLLFKLKVFDLPLNYQAFICLLSFFFFTFTIDDQGVCSFGWLFD